MLIALIVMLISSVYDYYRHDSTSSTSLYKPTSLVMPSVTICANTLVHTRSIEKHYPQHSNHIYKYLLPLYKTNLNVSTVPDNFLHFLKTENLERYYRNVMVGDELFLECLVNSAAVECSDYLQQLPVELRMCHTFHSDNFRPKRHETVSATRAGPNHGFTFLLHTDQYNSLSSLSAGIGFTVLVHDTTEYPLIEERSFAIGGGSEVYVSVGKSVSTYLKRPYSQQDCVLPDQVTDDTIWPWIKHYSPEACNIKCVSDEAFQSCNCSYYSTGIDACTLYDLVTCVLPSGRQIGLLQSFQPDQCSNRCLPLCTESKYNVKVTQMPLAEEAVNQYNTRFNMSANSQSYTKLIVYYENLRFTSTSQLPAISTGQMFSNFGGLMGLFLGASLISLLEWLEFFCYNCVKKCSSSDNPK